MRKTLLDDGDRPFAARGRGRSRFVLEREAAAAASNMTARLRARAERAESELADLRRDSSRAIHGLRKEVAFWQLVATGVDRAEAARLAGFGDEPVERS